MIGFTATGNSMNRPGKSRTEIPNRCRRRLSMERLEERRLLAGDWPNPRNALDVDDSGIDRCWMR